MKTVYRTYKFRMYPNAEQRQVLARYFGSVRFIYNHYLAERKRQYEETGKSDNYAKQAKDLVALKRTEGFDWLKSLVTTSEGETYDNNRYTKKYEQKLASAQKHLSRKQKDSNGWEEQRMKVAKIHETLANSRKDWQHKVSADVVRRYDTICIEDLGVKKMEERKKGGKKNRLRSQKPKSL